MLDFIRRNTQGGVGKVIMSLAMGLLILSFGIWGIGDIFRGRSDSWVAKVGPAKISATELQQTFQRQLARLRQQAGQEIDAEQARAIGLDRRVMSELIDIKLFDLAADNLGVSLPDSIIAKQIQSMDAFKNEKGVFDRARFQEALRSANFSEDDFVEALRSDLVRNQLLEAMLGGLSVPDAVANPLLAFQGEKRLVRYLVVPPEAAGPLPPVTDEEIRKRYEASRSDYMAPEYRKITFVTIDPAAIAKTIPVTDEAVRARYEQHKADYGTPEKRELEQLIFQDEAAARAASDALKSGKSFTELAKEQGKIPDDIALGQKAKPALPAQLADAVFATQAGGVAGPIEGPFGWTLIHVVKVMPAVTRGFEEMKGQIAQDIQKDAAADKVYKLSTQFEDARGGGGPIEDAAKAIGVQPVTIAATDQTGKDPSGAKIAALDGRPAILANAFKAHQGEDMDLAQTPEGGYHVVRVDSVTPPAERPLDAVKDSIRADLEAEKRAVALDKLADDLAAKGRAGTSIDAIATGLGRTAFKSEPLTRGTNNDTFSPIAIGTLFKARPGDFLHAPLKTGSGVVLMQLDGVEKPGGAELAAAAAQLKPRIGQILGDELATQYAATLQARYKVDVNERAVQSALGGS